MTEATSSLPHPLLQCASALEAAVDRATGSDPAYLSTDEKADLLVRLTRLGGRIEGLRLGTLAVSGDVAEQAGARSAGAWLAGETHADTSAGRRWQRLADGLDRHPLVGEAVRDGRLGVAHAETVLSSLDDLPADLDPEVREAAARRLVDDAVVFEPRRLRVLGRRILELVAPGVADDHERRLLERQERRARRRMRITVHDLGDGLSRAVVDLPTSVMDRWMAQLQAYTSPRRAGSDGRPDAGGWRDPATGERLSYPRRLAHAFCALLEARSGAGLPQHGGDATTLMVMLDLDTLVAGLGVAELSSGSSISAGEARRLACNAALVPVVLGGDSQPLDLGRSRRLYSPPQRKAMAVRDRHCRAVGCDVPAAWCEAHHLHPWSRGGLTDLADGVLFCSFHHHCAHDPAYDLVRRADGDIEFHRRT